MKEPELKGMKSYGVLGEEATAGRVFPGPEEGGCLCLDSSSSCKRSPWSCSPLGEVSRQVVSPRYSSSTERWLLIFCGH